MLDKKIKIAFASHNTNKLKEIIALIASHPKGDLLLSKIDFCLATDFNLESPEETGNTFFENALLKAKFVSEATNLIALSDDSGLSIAALNGDPGVFSARWLNNPDEKSAFTKINTLLQNHNNYNATFHCEICLYFPKNITSQLSLSQPFVSFEGLLEGKISFPSRGSNGFAYDKIFVPNKYTDSINLGKTLAEISPEEKNIISHRKIALEKTIDFLLTKMINNI